MFLRKPLTLSRVRDTVPIKEGDELIELRVDRDASALVTDITAANERLKRITGDSTDEERREAARALASAIFGGEQADRLEAFYSGDSACVITICGIYFSGRLAKLITKAQKR